MAWQTSSDHDDALETANGAFLALTDPVYGYYSLRTAEDPDTSLMEAKTLAEFDAYIARAKTPAPAL